MTMTRSRRIVSATEFKAHCLELLDQVAEHQETLFVAKRGKIVAKVVAARESRRKSLRGSVRCLGDITGPIDEQWDALR